MLYRRMIQPSVLKDCGVTFSTLCDIYGLTPDLMVFLKYSLDEWLDLEMTPSFINELTPEQWFRLFGKASRTEVLSRLTKTLDLRKT